MSERTARKSSIGWELAEFLRTCRRLLSARGEANSAAHAATALQQYQHLSEPAQLRFFEHLDQDFGLDPAQVLEAAQRYAAKPTVQTLKTLTAVAEPPRQELLRRLNRAPGGTALIVQMRRQLLRVLPLHPQLAAVEADFFHLLSSWFNPGFLEMQQVDWNSPAQLLEKIIQHEAVHAIDGWDDLRRRLQPDRRCFAFFHPQLPGEPLIFVEIALVAGDARSDCAADRKGGAAGRAEAIQSGDVLFDQQLPAGTARRVARQLPDQARCGAIARGVSIDTHVLHAVADPGLCALAGRSQCRGEPSSSRCGHSCRLRSTS